MNIESINFEKTGGMFDVTKRVLQTYTLHTHTNGCIIVRDDKKNGSIAGSGFADAAAAVAHYKRFDEARIAMY